MIILYEQNVKKKNKKFENADLLNFQNILFNIINMAYFCSHPAANFLSIPRCDVNATFRTENGFISINKQFDYESSQRKAYKNHQIYIW